MPRPKVPIVSRRKALEAALAIIDQDGLEGLSMRRLGEELGVHGASLYHHFPSKSDIIVRAAELALEGVRDPDYTTDGWRQWLPRNVRALRDALARYPALIPVILDRRSTGMGGQVMDRSAKRLIEEGVPVGAVMPLLDAVELFAIGSALHQRYGDERNGDDAVAELPYPYLVRSMAERGLSADEIFDVVTASVIDAIDRAVAERQARWMPHRFINEDETGSEP